MHSDTAQFYSELRNVVVRSYCLLPNHVEPRKGFLCILYVVIFVISLVLSHFKLRKP